MTTTRALMLVAALALADTAWAADTDVENPSLRELPLQHSPISGGRKHQPTASEIQEREQARSPAPTPPDESNGPARPNDDLYQRVLRQSQRSAPRAIDPDQ
jgi:hypothetical protein